jgi:ketosteroid isomerase-like protein
MSVERFDAWLDAYRVAWETRDPDAVVALYTEDATYQETPFDEPMRGHDAIRDYWTKEVVEAQSDIRFSSRVLAVVGDTCLAHWHCTFRRRSGKGAELDGVFLFDLAGDGRCRTFREWWHYRDRER